MNQLIINIDKLHTTKLGNVRIKNNLSLKKQNAVQWCKKKILDEKTTIEKRGKNWYIYIDNYKITVNATSYTIITAHINI